jgi:hypothetical protein
MSATGMAAVRPSTTRHASPETAPVTMPMIPAWSVLPLPGVTVPVAVRQPSAPMLPSDPLPDRKSSTTTSLMTYSSR